MNESVLVACIVVGGWIFSVCFHEFAHALTAYIGGDRSVKSKGYLNFNPFAYSDIRLSVILPTLFILIGGIGLPGASVQIREDQLRHPLWSSLVAAAGPFATFLFSLALALLIVSGVLPDTALVASCWLLNIEIVVLILNLLPIPGLDGFGIIEPFLSKPLRERLQPLYKHGFLILIALLWVVPGPNYALWLTAAVILNIMGIHPLLVDKGESLYKQGAFPVAAVVIVLAGIAYYIKTRNDWYGKGQKLLEAGKISECVELANQVLQKGENASAYRLSALALSGLAEKASKENPEQVRIYLKEAAEASKRCVELDERAFENWLCRGFVLQQMQEPLQALACFDKALSFNQSSEFAHFNKCKILWLQQDYARMLKAAEVFEKELPASRDGLFFKAVALAGLERFDESLAGFEKCIAKNIHKEDSQAMMQEVKILAQKQTVQKAESSNQ